MPESRSTICLTFDFDAISIWIGPNRASVSPSAISRGEFGPIGVERILRLLDRKGIAATFFTPGHTAETYPDSVKAIVAAGHELGHHGYLHENPCALETREQERDVLLRGLDALDRVAGIRPAGYRSPAWDNSPHTVDLLLENGFRYESSLMASDFTPYFCRTGDTIQQDGPCRFGASTELIEMPVNWLLDDYPHFEFMSWPEKINPGLSAGSKVEEIWGEEFQFMHAEVDNGVFTLTMHPQIIGRGHRMLMLERLIDRFASYDRVDFTTLGAAAEAFRNDRQGA